MQKLKVAYTVSWAVSLIIENKQIFPVRVADGVVLDMDQSYHNRKWENQHADIRKDLFTSSLIEKGEFDSENLDI